MLIKCPECGKEISDKSKQCIHCGFPLEGYINSIIESNNSIETWEIKIDGKIFNMSEIVKCCNEGNFLNAAGNLKKLINGNSVDVENILVPYFEQQIKVDTIQLSNISKEENQQASRRMIKKCQELGRNYFQSQPKPTPPTPTCPKCGSTAITAGQRGYSSFWGFLGSNKTVNRCANCGHTWTP